MTATANKPKRVRKAPVTPSIPTPVAPPASSEPMRIDQRAMLVSLSVSMWEGRRLDKDISQEVARNKHAEQDAGRWWTAMIPPKETAAILSACNKGRAIHYKLTLPWQDSGARILPAAMFLELTKQLREAKETFVKEVDAFVARYPDLVKSAPKRLGAAFKADRFPNASSIRNKFRWEVRVMPIPTANDFRVDLGTDANEAIKRDIEQQSHAAITVAMGDLWERLHKIVSNIAERLKDPEAKFKDSLIGNLVEIADLLPKMNVLNDPNLEDMRQQVVKKLTTQKPDELRKDKTVRSKAAKDAQSIVDAMAMFLPKKED